MCAISQGCVFLVILVVATLLHFIVVFAQTPASCLLLLFFFRIEFIVLIVFLGDTHTHFSEAGSSCFAAAVLV